MLKKHLTKAHMKQIGQKGGKATLKAHGPEFFAKLASKRKHHGGGRPPKPKRKVA